GYGLACGGRGSSTMMPAEPSDPVQEPVGFRVAILQDGLDFPVKLAFAPDGRLFFTEKGGRVRILQNSQLVQQPFVELTVESDGEAGLIGIALDPNFSSNRF